MADASRTDLLTFRVAPPFVDQLSGERAIGRQVSRNQILSSFDRFARAQHTYFAFVETKNDIITIMESKGAAEIDWDDDSSAGSDPGSLGAHLPFFSILPET